MYCFWRIGYIYSPLNCPEWQWGKFIVKGGERECSDLLPQTHNHQKQNGFCEINVQNNNNFYNKVNLDKFIPDKEFWRICLKWV